MFYTFSIGLLGSLETSGGQQLSEQLILEAYSWPSSGQIAGIFKNVGSSPIDIGTADVFVNGNSAGHPGGGCSGLTLSPHQSCSFTVNSAAAYVPGEMYPVKVITISGGVFSFSLICGGSG